MNSQQSEGPLKQYASNMTRGTEGLASSGSKEDNADNYANMKKYTFSYQNASSDLLMKPAGLGESAEITRTN